MPSPESIKETLDMLERAIEREEASEKRRAIMHYDLRTMRAAKKSDMTRPNISLSDPRSLAMATKAAGMMAAGDSLAAVARSMGMAADTLSYHVRKHGFTIKNHPATKTISDAVLFAASQRIKAKTSTRKQESARLGLADSTLKVKLRRFREAQAMGRAA